MTRLFALVLLVLVGLVVAAPAASARPMPCVQYVDPIHMGSYEYCPLG